MAFLRLINGNNYLNMECDKIVWNNFELQNAGPVGVAWNKVGYRGGITPKARNVLVAGFFVC